MLGNEWSSEDAATTAAAAGRLFMMMKIHSYGRSFAQLAALPPLAVPALRVVVELTIDKIYLFMMTRLQFLSTSVINIIIIREGREY
ncbi:CLUMA_CG017730, isoform A [Clunio marinus]|uniref:CLUMA_CG017730, isoform A n=1 Tax=Clunio marinus TaxID=568069 RepID=A0A1J1IY87_9DIPT|nr:CLUMA_CG017730, isoform A [Clunio marinus]